MKTAFIGAGPAFKAVLDLVEKRRLAFLNIAIEAVVDLDPNAVGLAYARERGWPTYARIEDALTLPGLELVVELTGSDEVLAQIQEHTTPGIRVMDHVLARIFWDLDLASQRLKQELQYRTNLETSLRKERSSLQEVLDALPDVVMVLDPNLELIRVNRRFGEVTGISPRKARGRPCWESFCRNPAALVENAESCPARAVLRSGHPTTLVLQDGELGGREGHFQISARPIFDRDGDIVRIVETCHEITERVLLKRETEESASRFEQIMKAVHGIITIKDLEGRYQVVNPGAERFYGVTRDRLVGHKASEALPPEVVGVIEHNDDLWRRQGGHHVAEEIFCLDGKERILVSERFPIRNYMGRAVALCCVSRDDTRQRELQREFQRSERLAAVGKLAAGIAHELNNPLTGVLTFAEDLLLEAEPDDPARADYELIMSETMRCRRIVRDLLDFSRQQTPELGRAPINPVVRRTVTMVERQASFHDVHFELDLPEGLPDVRMDAGLIQQALLNLVINARDAMDGRGRVSVTTRLVDDAVTVSVSDTGSGIPPELRDRIFEPFFSTKGHRGNGLGLPAVMGILEQHDGRVELESEVGVGSTFRLVLPIHEGTPTGGPP